MFHALLKLTTVKRVVQTLFG